MDATNFDAFWNAYPRKEGRAACLKKWIAKKLDDSAALIVAHLKVRVREDKKWKEGFIPMPLTFINQERWTDEYAKVEHRVPPPSQQPYVPETYPQPCPHQATANGVLMLVLQKSNGVHPEKLPKLIEMKNQMGQRLKNLYGENQIPEDDWRRIKNDAYDWMLKEVRETA